MLQEDQRTNLYERTVVPVDRSLPGFSDLLVPEKVCSLISGQLSESSIDITGCRVLYLRYKPETNCIIAYMLQAVIDSRPEEFILYAKLYTVGDFENAVDKSNHHRWVSVPGAQSVLIFRELKAIMYFYPNDCVMDGLRLTSDPKKIQRILYENYDKFPEEEWRISDKRLKLTTVRYKPERRAVIRCDTRAANRKTEKRRPLSVFLRFYGDDHGSRVFALQEELFRLSRTHGVFAVPRPIAYLPQRRLLVMETVHGKDLPEELRGDRAVVAVTQTAIALATLHSFVIPGLPERSIDQYIAETSATREMLKSILPDISDTVEEIFEMLEKYDGDPVKRGTIHGDFYCGQILCDDQGVTILDFDRSSTGDAIMDVGNFTAYLRLMNMNGWLDKASRLEQIFLSAYEEALGKKIPGRCLIFWAAFGLFQMSVRPFRSLENNWPEKTRDILEECRRILNS